MRIRVRFTLPLVVVSVSLAMGALSAAPAFAAEGEACPNEQLREESNVNPSTGRPYSTELPDCRGYEQVTPVEKGQGDVNEEGDGSKQEEPFQQAAVDGEGIEYGTHDALPGRLDGDSGLNGANIAFRGAEGWLTTQLGDPQLLAGGEAPEIEKEGRFLYYSPTLSCGVERTIEPLTVLPEGEQPGAENLYVWSRASGGYTLVSNTQGLGSKFYVYGASENCERVVFAAASLDLYEWDEGVLRVISKRPDGTVAPVKQAPDDAPAFTNGSIVGAVSSPGPQVFFTALSDTTTGSAGEIDSGDQEVFATEEGTHTVEVSRSHTSTPDNGAKFEAATPDGSQVVFIANYGLASNGTSTGATSCAGATAVLGGSIGNGCDLYDYNLETKTLSDLSADTNVSDTEGADVQGVLGISENASYVYFAAFGRLVPGKGESEAENKSKEEASVYVWHAGHIAYIAQLNANSTYNDVASGYAADLLSHSEDLASNVTPDGEYLLFTATTKPTGYENISTGGTLERELYLYSTHSEKVVCVSCNPSGARARGLATTSIMNFNDGYVARNLSESGDQVFFTSEDKLVSGAAESSINAYEWEREGVGSCTAEAAAAATEYSGGCIYLLARGGSVLDASANGESVFITSIYRLVAQDLDGEIDVYDARVGGGLPAPVVSGCAGEECQGALNDSPSLSAPVSESTLAEGDAPAPTETKVVVKTPAKQKALTRAQKLANALKACKQESKKKRARCEAQAHKRYGAKTKAKSKQKVAGKSKQSSGKGGK